MTAIRATELVVYLPFEHCGIGRHSRTANPKQHFAATDAAGFVCARIAQYNDCILLLRMDSTWARYRRN
jgi:hypothetical protein